MQLLSPAGPVITVNNRPLTATFTSCTWSEVAPNFGFADFPNAGAAMICSMMRCGKLTPALGLRLQSDRLVTPGDSVRFWQTPSCANEATRTRTPALNKRVFFTWPGAPIHRMVISFGQKYYRKILECPTYRGTAFLGRHLPAATSGSCGRCVTLLTLVERAVATSLQLGSGDDLVWG